MKTCQKIKASLKRITEFLENELFKSMKNSEKLKSADL